MSYHTSQIYFLHAMPLQGQVLLPSALAREVLNVRSILRWCVCMYVRMYVRTYVRVRHALGMSECNVTRFQERIRPECNVTRAR